MNDFASPGVNGDVHYLDSSGWNERPGWVLPLVGAVIGGTISYLVDPDCAPENEYACPFEVGGRVLLWATVGGVVGFLADRVLRNLPMRDLNQRCIAQEAAGLKRRCEEIRAAQSTT